MTTQTALRFGPDNGIYPADDDIPNWCNTFEQAREMHGVDRLDECLGLSVRWIEDPDYLDGIGCVATVYCGQFNSPFLLDFANVEASSDVLWLFAPEGTPSLIAPIQNTNAPDPKSYEAYVFRKAGAAATEWCGVLFRNEHEPYEYPTEPDDASAECAFFNRHTKEATPSTWPGLRHQPIPLEYLPCE
jgi:hypothetical protein